jgi:hypothetical protein
LIYEGLVHWVDDPKSGSHYEWGLSDGRPVPLVRGRCFQLRPCKWSDSTDKEPYSCTVEDVRWTVKLLRDPRCPGYSPVWSSLLREVILKQFFRVGDAAGEHVALTGPYPSDSWACNPNKDLAFSPAKATGFAEEARQKLRGAKLELLCPNQSPAVEACREIQKQVGAVGIDLKLINLDPNAFHDRVARGQDFDLAYWRHDYPDVTCWLEPLLDASPEAQVPGGPNFMGYTPDPELAELFRDVKLHKCFRDIQKKTHAIHEHIARTAVLVPLWQTSTYVAVGARMHRENVLDPLVLFGRVERWRLGPR